MKKIIYIVESKKWVQYKRIIKIKELQNQYDFLILTPKKFYYLWLLGFYRKRHIIFSSWRLIIYFQNMNKNIFNDNDFNFFLASVTSHSNLNDLTKNIDVQNFQYNKAIYILKKCKLVTVNSLILYDLLKNRISNLLYCPNGVDLDKFKYDPKEKLKKPITFGIVGKERIVKNFLLFKKITKYFENNNDLIFKSLITDRSLSDTLDQEGMCKFYQSLDFYLCLSTQEGTPNTALEAASCGVPIISTSVGNMPELIQNGVNGFIIDNNFESVIEKIIYISNIDPNKYQSLSINIRNSIERRWSWQNKIDNFLKAYKILVS
jgi:glycosyltransferase involved in cell wall biosynthesis